MASLHVRIYTDGSCISCNEGGWAFCLIKGDAEFHVCGGDPSTTNNRMEMMAVIEGLRYCEDDECTVYTDSKLVMNCASNLWKRKANLDLWELYDKASVDKTIHWKWVKGHSGDYYNDLVDKLANGKAREFKQLNGKTIK
jgi:ribonuclease HI